eukprot:s999_g16.t1
MADDRNLKRFSGEDDDPGKALKRWKLWATARMLTYKDLKPEQRGPWVFTLLDGKAWDACEHLSLEKLASPDGESEIWKLLESRFPEKEPYDQMGEALGAVFALAAKDGEDLKSWTGRVRDTFEQCQRKGNVKFPEEAKGWILLHCAGMSEEQRAIVKAKSQGQLGFELVSQALRSCFPEYKASGTRKKTIGVYQAEDVYDIRDEGEDLDADGGFKDVEAFISEYQGSASDLGDVGTFTEEETAEALAVSWSERRREIAKLKQSRQFGAVAKDRRSFRIEIEELKKKTRCRKCNKLGHWARECRAPPADRATSSSSTAGAPTGAGYVQLDQSGADYVEVEEPEPTFVGAAELHSQPGVTLEQEVLTGGLVSSPGFGVVDSGCGKTLIGATTLQQLSELIEAKGYGPIKFRNEENTFRFGNGMTEKATQVATLPLGIAQTYGTVDAAVITGSAPLLLGRPTLVKMGACLDFQTNHMSFLGTTAELKTNSAGQLLVDVLSYPIKPVIHKPSEPSKPEATVTDSVKASTKVKVTLKNKECRCLLAQMSKKRNPSKCAVAELFSPPRFAVEARARGREGLSYDIKQGWDLTDPKVQSVVDAQLDEADPDLLVVCPTCTHRGGWEHLNRCYRSPLETARLLKKSREQMRFSIRQIRKQLDRGGEIMFEHPWGSDVWNDAEIIPLRKKYGVRRVDMCAYGLRCPDTKLPIRKATGLILSCRPEDRNRKLHVCPGCPKHRLVEGRLKDGRNVSEFVAEYTKQLVRSIMDLCVPEMHDPVTHHVDLAACDDVECLSDGLVPAPVEGPQQPAENAQPESEEDAKIRLALKRLHVNLGHPHNRDLMRILHHSKASAKAISLAKDFECSVCANHQKPASSLPAKVSRAWDFNDKIGLDVKYLPGWRVNQRVPCVSIVDYASSLHVMAPIFRRETAELVKGVLRDAWINWAGPPKILEVDPARTNLSDELGQFCQTLGIDMVHIAADAHWQLGKVERHSQWFEQILEKVHDEHPPTSPEEFVDNVMMVQIAKNSLITVAGASPYQIVFGRNPRVPQDLLQEEAHVPAVDATLFESASQRASAIRQSARMAVLQCQDEKALKAALRSRPRPRREFSSGDWVYYWRSQKWQQGQLVKGGRWYGAAMILGRLGINYVVAHRRSIFRCAPEQLRFATSEEQEVATFDASELLGIKTLLEKGQFPTSQFTDLVHQDGPPVPEVVMEEQVSGARSAAQIFEDQNQEPEKADVIPSPESPVESPNDSAQPPEPAESAPASGYGPVRRLRHRFKSPEEQLYRPPAMAHDDLVEILQEAIPQMIDDQLRSVSNADEAMPTGSSPRGDSSKREASADLDGQPQSVRPRTDDAVETLLCQAAEGKTVLTIEALTAAFIQKKLQKEIPATGNDPSLQTKVDDSKSLEWETLLGKNAIRIWTGEKARAIRKHQADRFIGSRFVIVNKQDEEGERVKSRWCLQGHLDPDFHEKILSGACHSPTLHPLSRALLLQILSSKRWTLQLGDIKGAFLEAGPLDKKFSPLYAHQPKGGIPGVDPLDVIEVTGNVYGANDAPLNWFNTFDMETKKVGWQQSQFDRCLYYLRDEQGNLVGVLGAHVDDTITGGQGPLYEKSIAQLKQRFPYRKWRIGNGEFCGIQYRQCPQTFNITYGQKEYAEHMRPINLTKDRLKNKDSPATEREIRWCPSELMLADALTKDQFDPSELLRTALEIGEYQLNAEAFILEIKKNQREVRKKGRQKP